jgi:Carboxypeptidase regulatory-like domain
VALIKGRVVDAERRPVAGAVIRIVAAPGAIRDIGQLADEAGQFVLAAGPGRYTFGARSDEAGSGDTTVDLPDVGDVAVEIVLRR